jgi:hypothetical protein
VVAVSGEELELVVLEAPPAAEGDDGELAGYHASREMTPESWVCRHGREHGAECLRCELEAEAELEEELEP